MEVYLVIMITIVAIAEAVRVCQNHMNLRNTNKIIERDCEWVKDTEITKKDFEVQREVFYLLREKLLQSDG